MNDLGLIGLGVMGANLARNFASRGINTAVFNRTYERTENFLKDFGNENLNGYKTLEEFISSLKAPRMIILMVKAGEAIDEVMKELAPLLKSGDIVVDAGNSFFEDTVRRNKEWAGIEINFVGMGVSGGEEGALHGPSIMPGGSEEAWTSLQPVLEKIAARDFNGGACVAHIGAGGAGHYVKMVHNGIEYAIMQLIAEIYDLARKAEGKSAGEIAGIFEKIQSGTTQSFLTEITIPVLLRKEGEDFLLDKVLDKAAQKGTGGWTAVEGLNKGVPISAISEAVFARGLSAQKDLRVILGDIYGLRTPTVDNSIKIDYEAVMMFGMLVAYAQGLHLIAIASAQYDWKVNLAEVLRIWQGGCIIRSTLLKNLREVFLISKTSIHLFESREIATNILEVTPAFRNFVVKAVQNEIALPVAASMMAYFDGLKDPNGPANLIQGLRDSFGAHTFERVDKPGIFHENWSNN